MTQTGKLRMFLLQDEAMEMVEWSLVGVVFALACASLWGSLAGEIGQALDQIGDILDGGPPCGQPPCGRGRGLR
jgi:hypothetical protein